MSTQIKKHFYDNRFIYTAFLVSSLILLAAYYARGIFPFGDRTILKVDLFHQYAPYLEELRSRLLSGKSLIYSWETGLGKDFLSQTAYYTTSPLNLLILLFPRHLISEAVALLILLKISLSSSFFAVYLKAHFRRNDLSVLIFGLMYGFCAFITCYYWNIMWLDTVALFPLAVLGCERLVSENKVVLYYVSLTLTMIVNFYLAVLVCILITLYVLVYTFRQYSWSKNRREILSAAGRFILVSFLCALSALVILAPVAAALSVTKVSDTAFPEFRIYPAFWQLVSAHFLGARDAVLARNEDMPNIYTGVLTVMLLPLYYSSRRISRREKLLYSGLLAFMLLCACIRPLDYLIHGFHFPANLPHRYTFVYSFILLGMAYRGFLELTEGGSGKVSENYGVPVKLWLYGAACIAVLFVYEKVIVRFVEEIDHVLSGTDLLLNILLIVIYLGVLTVCFLHKKKKSASVMVPKALLLLLLGCVIFENTYSVYQNMYDTGDRNAYISHLEDADNALEYMADEQEGEFFRTEFRRFTTINDGALYHYNGFSQFSSLAPGGISALMEHLGIAATSNSYRYYDPTSLIDAMFSLRYVMNKDKEFPPAALPFKYELDRQFGSVWVYRNDRVLPLGFMAEPEITEWETSGSQPFEVQNSFVHTAAGIQEDLFTLVNVDTLKTEYMETDPLSDGSSFNYTLTDPSDLALKPSVHAEFVSDRDQYIYLYVDAPNAQRFIYADRTVREDRELSAGRSLIDVGYVSKGEKVTVDFNLTKHGQFEKTYRKEGTVKLYAACYHDEVFQKAYDSLMKSPLRITSFEETRIEGAVDSAEDGILFTSIPFIPGWKAAVDGEKAEILGLGDNGVSGIVLPEGRHTIVLEYHSPFFLPAAMGSLCGIVLFLIYLLIRSRKQKP